MGWDLTKQPTRLLLKWLELARSFGGAYDPTENHNAGISVEELKKELATREHIMNKVEGEAYRRARAQGKSV